MVTDFGLCSTRVVLGVELESFDFIFVRGDGRNSRRRSSLSVTGGRWQVD